MKLYETVLDEQFTPGWYFDNEAALYIADNIDLSYEDAVRHVLRYTLVPMYQGISAARAQHIKDILRWALNCADDEQMWQLNGAQDWILDDTDPPRLLFEWWWKELFGDEDWWGDDICDAELVYGNPPPALRGRSSWNEVIDREVLRFPRRDGLPPGHGAPQDPNRVRPGA